MGRSRLVEVSPSNASIVSLSGALLLKQQEDWQLDGRRGFSEPSRAKPENASGSVRFKQQPP
jgi:hypothetical protein